MAMRGIRHFWNYHKSGKCDVCAMPIMHRDPVMTSQNGRAAHEWCVVSPVPRSEDVDKPAYNTLGMVEWRGRMWNPAPAGQLEPGCTSDELLLPAPDGFNDTPFRGVRPH